MTFVFIALPIQIPYSPHFRDTVTMGKVPKKAAKKVSTPGSYRLPPKSTTPAKHKTTPVKTASSKIKLKGRPVAKKNVRKTRPKMQLRATYTEEDLLEAVRLVKDEGMSIKAAAKHINSAKANCVPRHGHVS